MQGGPSQVRDGWLQGVETVVQRQERVLAEGYDQRFFLTGEHRRSRPLRPHWGIARKRTLFPFTGGLWVQMIPLSEGGNAVGTALYGLADGLSRAAQSCGCSRVVIVP